MSQITFKPGEFQTFRVVTKVHLGKINRDLSEGDVVEFDGQTLRMGGESHQVSTLKSAIKVKWLVPVEDTTTRYRPAPAGIQVRPAQDASLKSTEKLDLETVNDEERVVGDLASASLGQREGKLVEEGISFSAPDRTTVEIDEPGEGGEIEAPGDGAVVAKLTSPAKREDRILVDASTSSKVAQEIRKLDNPQGTTRLPVEHMPKVAKTTATLSKKQRPPSVFDKEVKDSQAVSAVIDNTPVEKVRIVIWDPTLSTKKRAERAVKEFGNNPDALAQIYKIETEQVQSVIKRFWQMKKAKQAAT